jgi:hypothetical protein
VVRRGCQVRSHGVEVCIQLAGIGLEQHWELGNPLGCTHSVEEDSWGLQQGPLEVVGNSSSGGSTGGLLSVFHWWDCSSRSSRLSLALVLVESEYGGISQNH